MRILIYNWKDLSHPAAGGAEVYVDAIARLWVEWGHEVTLFCARSEGQDEEGITGGVRIIRRGGRMSVYREARHFYRATGGGDFDVVLDVVNTRPFLSPTYVRDVPVVALIFQIAREIWSYEVPRPAAVVGRHWFEPRWLRRYASVPTLTISESSLASLEAYGLRQVSIVPVGLELPQLSEPPPREPEPTACFLGRLAANKRPDHALEAFRLARRSVPDAKMWVVGTGPMEVALRREFAREPVQFFGRVGHTEKLDLLARSHALLVTSVREGWGLVVTEAAALGTPSIGYSVPGLCDSLRASNGVEVKPTVEEMAAAVASALPKWAAGQIPRVSPGGVAPWVQAAQAILGHLAQERERVRAHSG